MRNESPKLWMQYAPRCSENTTRTAPKQATLVGSNDSFGFMACSTRARLGKQKLSPFCRILP